MLLNYGTLIFFHLPNKNYLLVSTLLKTVFRTSENHNLIKNKEQVCIRMRVCMCVHIGIYFPQVPCGGQRATSAVHIIRDRVSLWLTTLYTRAHKLPGTFSVSDSCLSSIGALGFQTCYCTQLYVSSWDLNSDPHACTESALPPEASP